MPMAAPRIPQSIHEIAAALTAKGYSIVPLFPESKRPLVQTWTQLHYSVAEIKAELHPDTDANFGLILGRRIGETNRWIVCNDVDTDDPVLLERVRCALGVAEGEQRYIAKRGRKGVAIFGVVIGDDPPRSFKASVQVNKDGRTRRVNVVEWLAAGNQTVLPPSIHPDTGEPYVWLTESLLDVPVDELPVFDFPTAWEEIKWAVRDPESKVFLLNDMTPSDPQTGVAGTMHDSTLAAVASLVAHGWTDEQIWNRVARATERADPQGERPGWESTVRKMIADARQKNFDESAPANKADPIWLAAHWLVNEWRGPGLVLERRGMLAAYENGWYRLIDSDEIERIVAHEHQASARRFVARHWRAVFDTARPLTPRRFPERRIGETFAHRVCLQNGTYDMDTGALLSWSPDDYLISQLPFAYDPAATCPLYESVLQRAFWKEDRDDAHVRQSIDLFEEFVAHTLFECFDFAKMLIIVGEPRSGKSTLGRIVQMLHSPEAVSTVAFSDFKDPRLAIAMVNTLVNISSETQVEGAAADDFIKAITSGDPRQWRELYSASSKNIRATARLIVICNQLFRTYDSSGAMESRMLVLRCDNTLSEEERNPRLVEDIEAELPGIFNRIAIAWQRLFARGRFAPPQLSYDEIATFTEENNIVAAWIKEATHEGMAWENPDYVPDAAARKLMERMPLTGNEELYSHFRLWCEAHGNRLMPSRTWGKLLVRLRVPGVDWAMSRIRVGGRSGSVIRGKPLHLLSAGIPSVYDFDRQQAATQGKKNGKHPPPH